MIITINLNGYPINFEMRKVTYKKISMKVFLLKNYSKNNKYFLWIRK